MSVFWVCLSGAEFATGTYSRGIHEVLQVEKSLFHSYTAYDIQLDVNGSIDVNTAFLKFRAEVRIVNT